MDIPNGSFYGINDKPILLSSAIVGQQLQLRSNGDMQLGEIDPVYVDLSTSSGSNGNIIVTGKIVATDSIKLSADGYGQIVSAASGLLLAPSVTLISGNGNIGSAQSPIRIEAEALSLSTGANAFISQAGTLDLGDSAIAGHLELKSS